jgi:hypothetical protein
VAYSFKRDDASVEKGVKRIALDQAQKAIDEIDDTELERAKTVHQVRKRMKKIRGLLRLVRPSFGDYSRENAFYRDTARELSDVRDAAALVETFDDLKQRFGPSGEMKPYATLRQRLLGRARRVRNEIDVNERLSTARARLAEGRDRIKGWHLSDTGFDALEGGLKRAVKGARKGMADSLKNPTDEGVHEWRKRVKDHWYHTRLLCPIWPEAMAAHESDAKILSDLLGDDHNLSVLRETLRAESDKLGKDIDLDQFGALLERRQTELRAQAQAVGRRLLAEKPSALVTRWRSYWEAWREDEDVRHLAVAAE